MAPQNQTRSSTGTILSTVATMQISNTQLFNKELSTEQTAAMDFKLETLEALEAVQPDKSPSGNLKRSPRATHRPTIRNKILQERPKPLDRKEAVSQAVKASGLQRALSKGVMQAIKFSAVFLRNDKKEFKRPPKETLTYIDYDYLIPHLRTMSRLIALLANIEDRAYDSCQVDHWDAIFETMRECFRHREKYNLEDRSGDVFKQILRYVVPNKLFEEKNIDLEETDFVTDEENRGPRTRAQDFETLIDYVSVVCQKATLECDLYTKARRKLGRKRTVGSKTESKNSPDE